MKYTMFSLCLLLSLFFPKTEVVAGYDGDNHHAIDSLFRRLSKEEVSHLYTLLSESYAVGYFETLNAFSHEKEVAHLKATAKANLRKMQNDAKYHSIFRKAQGDKYHLARYIAHWHQQGKGRAHTQNLINESEGELSPGDILRASPIEKSIISETVSFVTKIVTADDFGRITFVVFLFLVAAAMIVGFVGARCYPHTVVFKQIRYLLDY